MQNLNEEVDLDELESLKPTMISGAKTGTAVATTTTATAPATNPNIVSWGGDDDDEVSGSVLKSAGCPYLKVSDNAPARLAFIPGGRIVGAPTHYDARAKKYFVCDSRPGVARAKCCTRLGDPKGRAVAWVFRYTNADPKNGKLAANVVPQVEVNIFCMSRSNYDDLKGSLEEGSSVYDVDYRVAVSEKQLARKIGVISRAARWLEIKDAALELAKPFLADPAQLQRALGRTYAGEFEDAKLGDVENL